MKRIFLTATASSMLALGVPAVALAAHNGRHHHGAHHARTHTHHAKRARVVVLAAASVGSPSGPTTTSPATPSNESAGTVTTFTTTDGSTGMLTITPTGGTPVSGQVTEETEITCWSASPPPTTGDDEGGGDDESASSGEHGGPSNEGQTRGQRSEQGDGGDGQGDEGDDQGEEGEAHSCTAAALVPGTMVRRAELRLTGKGAVWEKVELIH